MMTVAEVNSRNDFHMHTVVLLLVYGDDSVFGICPMNFSLILQTDIAVLH